MTVFILFTTVGTDAGPFNLYSDVDGYSSAFEVGVTPAQLLSGFPSNVVPLGTTIIRAKSFGLCTNFLDMPLLPAGTTTTSTTIAPTTTTTSSSSSTTTTSSSSTTTTSTTLPPTTTTTTTAAPSANIYGFGSTGDTNPATACGFNDDSVDLYSPDAVLVLGSILYTDLAMTLPFDGLGWSWHTGGLPGNTFVISNVGVILGGASC